MKIIILVHYFPPLNSVASLRPYSWARYWTKLGHDVTVVTTKKHRNNFDLNFENNGFNIKEIEYKGFNKVTSLKKKEVNTQSISIKARIKSILKNIVLYLRRRYGILAAERIPESIHFWIKPAFETIIDECDIKNTDVIVSSYAPPSAHIIAHKLKKKYPNIFWVADYRDSWTVSNYSQAGFPLLKYYERLIENKLLEKVDLISVAFKTLEDEFSNRFETKEVTVIENGCFDEQITNNVKSLINKSENNINLVYTGSFGGYRSLSFFYYFLLELKKYDSKLYDKINLYILGSGDEKYIHEKMIYIGKVSYGESLSYQKDADILLLVESGEEIASGNMTGKVYEYIAAKKPIIAFGPKKYFSIAKRLIELDAGIVSEKDFENVYDSIKKAIKKKFEFGNIDQYTREYQAKKLIKKIEKGLKYGK